MLVAGTTGSGKSVFTNSIILSILYHASPDEVKLILIDPKKVEFPIYNKIPHLLIPVVTEPLKAAGALGWAVNEMNKRYLMFEANNVKNLQEFNDMVLEERNKPAEEQDEVRAKIDLLPQIGCEKRGRGLGFKTCTARPCGRNTYDNRNTVP